MVDGEGPLGALSSISLPPELTGGNYKSTADRLGYRFLRPYRGAVVGGFKVVCHEGHPTRWSFENV